MKAKPSFLVSPCSTLNSSSPEKQQHRLTQGLSSRISGARLGAWATVNPETLRQSPALIFLCQIPSVSASSQGKDFTAWASWPAQTAISSHHGARDEEPDLSQGHSSTTCRARTENSVPWQVCTSSMLENTGCFYNLLQHYLLHQTFIRISIICRVPENIVNGSKSAEPNKNTTECAKC